MILIRKLSYWLSNMAMLRFLYAPISRVAQIAERVSDGFDIKVLEHSPLQIAM